MSVQSQNVHLLSNAMRIFLFSSPDFKNYQNKEIMKLTSSLRLLNAINYHCDTILTFEKGESKNFRK